MEMQKNINNLLNSSNVINIILRYNINYLNIIYY